MRNLFRRGEGRHKRRTARRITIAAVALALVGGGTLAATSFADDSASRPELLPPKGYTVVDTGEGEVHTNIIGGSDTSYSEAPYVVQLFFDWNKTGDTYYFTCGGTLVAPNKVVTAAHCLYNGSGGRLDWANYGAVLAGTNLLAGGPDNSKGQFIDVTRTYVREGYSDSTINNDIAVLTLAKPASGVTTKWIEDHPVEYTTGQTAVSYGWGLTGSDESTASLASTLQKIELPLHPGAECKTNLDQFSPGTFQPSKMICAGQPGTGNDATGATVCPGDSGSPMVMNGEVIGVTSWGIGDGATACNYLGSYQAFTKVGYHFPYVHPKIDDNDISRDGKADVFLRHKDGTGYYKKSTGSGLAPLTKLSGDWSRYNLVLQTDLNRDGYQDYLLRGTSTGTIYWRHRSASSSTYTDTKLFGSWGTRKYTAAPGDLTGDRYPDVVSVQSDGKMYVYPGKGNGTFDARIYAGSGYSGYNSFRGSGDLNRDGRADILARRSSDGAVFLLKGTGKAAAPFAARVQVRTWTDYNVLAAPGDVTGDGIADWIARTPGGTLYLYPGTGQGTSSLFGSRIKIYTGYQNYNLWG
ncbi:trypsin-like serine protease [Streptomyces sp. NPDC051940]|uniref:trypsin-like serine protease n=1 Tax=Streptomyces sp. NPDC051940 TaxID=3155675 RepID=UPI00341C28FE